MPVIGGRSVASLKKSRTGDCGKRFSYKNLATRAIGKLDKSGQMMSTVVASLIEGVTIAKRLTVDKIEATLNASKAQESELSIAPGRTRIANLRLDGILVKVELDLSPFVACDTKGKLDQACQDSGFLAKFGRQFLSPSGGSGRTESADVRLVTIVKKITTKHPDVELIGSNGLRLKDYGSIFLGELLIQQNHRRLTMLRAQLGSPVGGTVVCGEVESNGTMVP